MGQIADIEERVAKLEGTLGGPKKHEQCGPTRIEVVYRDDPLRASELALD